VTKVFRFTGKITFKAEQNKVAASSLAGCGSSVTESINTAHICSSSLEQNTGYRES